MINNIEENQKLTQLRDWASAYAYEWAGEDKMRVDKPFSVDVITFVGSDENT